MISHRNFKLIQALKKKKYRRLHTLFVIEGRRLISEAVTSSININELFVTTSFTAKPQHAQLMDLIASKAIRTNHITDKECASISDTKSPSGILAICEMPIPSKMDFADNWLYLDEFRDPGNLGALLRSAAWFGVKNIALSDNCIDPYNSKVLRGGMGAHLILSIHEKIALSEFKDKKSTIIGAVQNGKSVMHLKPNQFTPWVLVIGSEARGINKNNLNLIDLKITIQKIGYGESLNAAIAGSIILNQLTSLP